MSIMDIDEGHNAPQGPDQASPVSVTPGETHCDTHSCETSTVACPKQPTVTAHTLPTEQAGYTACPNPPTVAAHTLPTEQQGYAHVTMVENIVAMTADAAEQDRLVRLIAVLLEETVARNDSLRRASELENFEREKAPVAPASYVRRIAKYGGCSSCCFVIGLIYLKRLKRRESSVCLTSCNFQRLFLVAVMLAAKFLDDSYYSNKHWAEVGGMTTAELNGLELEFLFRIGFSLALSREEYDDYARLLAGAEKTPVVASTSSRPAESRAPSEKAAGDVDYEQGVIVY